jgi:hypothetical protein
MWLNAVVCRSDTPAIAVYLHSVQELQIHPRSLWTMISGTISAMDAVVIASTYSQN